MRLCKVHSLAQDTSKDLRRSIRTRDQYEMSCGYLKFERLAFTKGAFWQAFRPCFEMFWWSILVDIPKKRCAKACATSTVVVYRQKLANHFLQIYSGSNLAPQYLAWFPFVLQVGLTGLSICILLTCNYFLNTRPSSSQMGGRSTLIEMAKVFSVVRLNDIDKPCWIWQIWGGSAIELQLHFQIQFVNHSFGREWFGDTALQ